MGIIFVIANTFLIRGVDNTFHSLNAAEGSPVPPSTKRKR